MTPNISVLRVFYEKPLKTQLLRPLLSLNRCEVIKLCVFWRLPISIDTTNRSTYFRRNRLRQQILPTLRIFFNPKIDNALNRLIVVINSENNYFYSQIKEFKKFFKTQNLQKWLLKKDRNPTWTFYLPEALQRKVYKECLDLYFRKLTFNEINFLLSFKFYYF